MKRPACSERQTGACRRCGTAACQPCRRHEEPSKRQTHSDRLVGEDEAQGARRPMFPTGEAINPNRRTDVQRQERSTPGRQTVSRGRRDQLQPPDECPATEAINSQPPDWCPADEGPTSTPTAGRGPRTKGLSLRSGSIPSWATGGERIILRSCPCNRDHAPRFLWSETLEKA